jgi:hypothetical protein
MNELLMSLQNIKNSQGFSVDPNINRITNNPNGLLSAISPFKRNLIASSVDISGVSSGGSSWTEKSISPSCKSNKIVTKHL